jgi:hypothetical protein
MVSICLFGQFFSAFLEALIMTKLLWSLFELQSAPNILKASTCSYALCSQTCNDIKTDKSKNSEKFALHVVSIFFFFKCLILCAFKTQLSFLPKILTNKISKICPFSVVTLCGFQNKQRLFPYTALTEFFITEESVYCAVRT